MRRFNRHKVKHEKPETSSEHKKTAEEHDLAYYIHDRVELMYQVFSVLKHKDLKAIAPECVRRLSIDDLQELCTEELLGISSKRLLAILDGAEPPSDTESSSQSSHEVHETISLDSISSDEELLSQTSKKKHKHKRHDSKSKSKKHKKKSSDEPEELERSAASRAGLTVLELLELQARARAIRAQLQQEQAHKQVEPTPVESSQQSSDSEVEIKEEPAEVVEISSSDDEKPDVKELQKTISTENGKEKSPNKNAAKSTDTVSDKQKDTKKCKKKKDKSKKKDKTSKDKDINKDNDKPKDTEKNRKESTASTELETTKTNKSPVSDDNKVTKRVNDLIITVPQKSSRKIKLNRNKMTVSIPNADNDDNKNETPRVISVISTVSKPVEKSTDSVKKLTSVVNRIQKTAEAPKNIENQTKSPKTTKIQNKSKPKDKSKKKSKKKEKRDSIDEDHDEITLQLSDSEKMDLLEDFDRKDFDKISTTTSDSESSSSDSSEDTQDIQDTSKDSSDNKTQDTITIIDESTQNSDEVDCTGVKDEESNDITGIKTMATESKRNDVLPEQNKETGEQTYKTTLNIDEEINLSMTKETTDVIAAEPDSPNKNDNIEKETAQKETVEKTGYVSIENETQNVIVISNIDEIPNQENLEKSLENKSVTEGNLGESPKVSKVNENTGNDEHNDISEVHCDDNKDVSPGNSNGNNTKESDKDLSEGEISDRDSSEVEAIDMKTEVVCISDEETPKKKKKEKKAKKEKKKKSDFRESADQNFFNESSVKSQENIERDIRQDEQTVTLEDDDVYEILQLSDDSSCYEVEGTVLSKEPTVEEIAALSAKIDEIEREEAIANTNENENKEEPQSNPENDSQKEEIENISWKDRYLGSKKVKKVLSTSNILNALRKKNKELKRKMEENKKKEQEIAMELEKEKEREKQKEMTKEKDLELEEGSIDHYNTLQGSTRYVDPVPDPIEIEKQKELERIKEAEKAEEARKEIEKNIEMKVTGEMKKDAKQLLKMYKKLLKYNDVNKPKDPNKKKNKKKKRKEKESVVNTAVNNA